MEHHKIRHDLCGLEALYRINLFIANKPRLFGDDMRLMLVLALLALLPISAAEFSRPWENESWVSSNPNIWTFVKSYWWNLPEFQKTLDGARLAETSRLEMENPVATHVQSAENSYEKAKNDKDVCTATVMFSLGYIAFNPTMAFVQVFSNSSGCMSYRSDWISTADSTLLATGYSIDAADLAVTDARADFERIRFAGICDDNYTGPGSGSCAELIGAFRSVDNNIMEGDYGKYALMANYSQALKRGLLSQIPDISASASILGLVWGENGVVPSFRHARNLSRTAVSEAESGYQQGLASVLSRKQLAEKGMKELDDDGVMDITRASSGFTSGGAGSITERYASLKEECRHLESSLAESKLLHARSGDRGYLAGAIAGIEATDDGYSSLLLDLESLRLDARAAVEDQEGEAEAELSRAEKCLASIQPGQEASGLYDEAVASFDSAGGEGTLGNRFERYSKAAALARSACNAKSYDDELDDLASLASLKTLIELAEKDGINVASEKENLKLIPSLPPAMRGDAARDSVVSITSKARIRYEEGLLSSRKRIYDKLSLAGQGAADLYTDLAECEEGLIGDEGLALPDSIGHLKKLGADYARLEETVDSYMNDIVGNAMSTHADPLITSVRLDTPADIVLDAVMTNPRPYNATSVNAAITMDSPAQFVYNDISEGKDGVESVRSADGGKSIILVLSSVGPFETKRVVFRKESVLAHTVSKTSSASGLGGGKASLDGRIDFELETDIDSLEIPEEYECGLIDGLPPNRPLSAGKHALAYSSVVLDAYNESVENIKTYRIGTNSKVEYDIRIAPAMDLDSVPVFLTSINDSRITSFGIVCISGEPVREKARISDTQYSAKVTGLKKGKDAILRVSYTIEDTESYVRERLSSLEGLDMGTLANELLGQAKLQAAAGNFSEALMFIEKAAAASQQVEKEDAKLKERSDALEKGIREELGLLDAAISSTNSTSPFMQKLSTRRAELQRILAEAGDLNLSAKTEVLGKADQSWLGKELTAFKKESYAAYNDLKERFYLAGNTTTPAEFLLFDDAFRKLESGGRLEYAIEVLSALEGAEAAVVLQESASSAQKIGFKSLLEAVKADTRDALERYLKQAAAAKGTDYSSFFTESEKKVETLIEDVEDAADGEPRAFLPKLDALNKSEARMESTLVSLKNESEVRLSMIESIIASKDLPTERRVALESKADSMRSMISQGDYVNALRAGSAISKELDSQEQAGGNGVLVLGVSAMAVLAAVGVYISRGPKQKKELKKLTSFSGLGLQERHQQAGQEPQGRSSRSSPVPDRHQHSPPEDSKPEAPSA